MDTQRKYFVTNEIVKPWTHRESVLLLMKLPSHGHRENVLLLMKLSRHGHIEKILCY